jgi:dissimilatory sulfite reductase (desulfoviridin) alpha/beta subunit
MRWVMSEKIMDFTLEMPKVGVIRGVKAKDIELVGGKVVNLRTCARPYSNLYSVAQLRAIKTVSSKYGSGKVHLSPRHNLEIPEIKNRHLDETLEQLYVAGLFPGGAGTSVRNIFTCPDWCSQSLRSTQEVGRMVSMNFGDRDMPNKVTVSFAGCANGCSRPHNSDIGIIAVAEVAAASRECPAGCCDCAAACPLQAIVATGNGNVRLDERICNSCGKCVSVCPAEILHVERTGFRVLIGGKEGATIAFGSEIADFASEFELLGIIERVLQNYQDKAAMRPQSRKKKERLAEVIERLGINSFLEDEA